MRALRFVVAVLVATFLVASADASVGSKVLQEALEFIGKKFSKEVVEEGAEQVSRRMAQLAAKHGDDLVAAAFKRVGPRAGRVVGEAGEHSGVALRLLARHGDDALPLVGRASALKAVSRYGDDAASAIIKHGSVGETLVESFATKGAEALVKVTPQNGRRLAMLAAEGHLKPELLTVVTRYGDDACDFIWRNKGTLALSTVAAAFVADPEPFLTGAQQLTSTVAEAAVKPLADVPRIVASEAAAKTNWNGVLVVLGCGVLIIPVLWWRVVRQALDRLARALDHTRRMSSQA